MSLRVEIRIRQILPFGLTKSVIIMSQTNPYKYTAFEANP